VARVAGVDLPQDKQVEVGLTYLYGIGRTTSKEILSEAKIPFDKRVKDLTEEELTKIRNIIDNKHQVEGSLRSQIATNIKRLVDIGSYRGSRHRRGLPVRGQRTKSNARTRKGPRRTIANKKTAPSKG